MTDDQLDERTTDESTTAHSGEAPQYGVGPFSIREVALAGVWLVAFVVSFFSFNAVRFDSVWTSGLLWILTIGVPTVAVFLIVLRRLSPQGIRRVGSLGIDQFASVAFAVSTVVWLQIVWETVAVVAQGGPWLRTWVIWVECVLMLAGVLLTTFAPFIAPFDQDFRGRPEVPAHRNARPVLPITPRPAPAPRPAAEPAPEQPFDPAAGPAPYTDAPTAPDAAFADQAAAPSPYVDEAAAPAPYVEETVASAVYVDEAAAPAAYVEETADQTPYTGHADEPVVVTEEACLGAGADRRAGRRGRAHRDDGDEHRIRAAPGTSPGVLGTRT